MIGALIGDIIGSTHEHSNVKTEEFELFPFGSRFTDDSVLTLAVAEKLIANQEGRGNRNSKESYAMWYRQYYQRYPNAGFGQMFMQWAESDSLYVQRSYGNGAAMRVVPIGYAFDRISDVMKEVEQSCYYTHHHREAIKFARAIALCVFLAHHNCDKDEIKVAINKQLGITLNFTLDEIRERYMFDSRSKESVPQAIVAFLESYDYESAIRKAVSIGGDSDTIACMAGGIAQAYYKVIPDEILRKSSGYLHKTMKDVVSTFQNIFIHK